MSKRVHLVQFGGNTLAIHGDDPRVSTIVDAILYQQKEIATASTGMNYSIKIQDGEPVTYQFFHQDVLLHSNHNLADFAELCLSAVCRHLTDQSHDGLMFHAGAVCDQDDRVLLLPGSIGSGKTTLTAWLLAHGYGYLTDEMVFIPDQSLTVSAFNRPLHLKLSSNLIISPLISTDDGSSRILTGTHSTLIHPRALNSSTPFPRTSGVLCAILFPCHQAGASFAWEELSPAAAGLQLMQSLVNARNLPDHGFPHISRIASQIPAVRVTYSGFDGMLAAVQQFLTALL